MTANPRLFGEAARYCRHSGSCCRAVSAGVFLVFVVSAFHVAAAEVSVKPLIRTTVEFNDNRRLTTRPHDSVVGAIFDARASVFFRTPVDEFTITPRMRAQRYSGGSGLDTTDGFVDAGYRRRTERSEYRLSGNFTMDTALSSELLDNIAVPSNTRRTSFRVSPRIDHRFDERTTGTASFNYTDVTFDDGLRVGLVDYRYPIFALALSRALTERDDVSVSAYAARFEAPQLDSHTDTAGVTLALNHRFSATLDGEASVGASLSKLRPSPLARQPDETLSGVLFSVGLRKRLERTRFEANLSRSVAPTGNGRLVQRDELIVSLKHRLYENLTADAELGVFENSGPSGASSRSDRRYGRLNLSLRYRLSETWQLSGLYRYRYNRARRNPDAAQSNAFMVFLVHEGLDPFEGL